MSMRDFLAFFLGYLCGSLMTLLMVITVKRKPK